MKNITTIILGAASLILAIVISAVEQSDSSGDTRSHLVRFDEKNIQAVTLMRGGQTVEIKRIQGYWFFTSPETDRVNNNSMAALLDQLNHLTILDELEADELVDEMTPANLGMEGEEALHVKIETVGKGKTQSDEIVIGRAAPRSNAVYAKLASGKKRDGIAVVNGNPHDVLDAPYQTLLERRLVNVPPNAIVQAAVTTSKGGVVLQRKITPEATSPWLLAKPIVANADQEKAEDLIASILSLQIADVKSSGLEAMEIPNPLPEDSAVVQFGIYGSDKPVVLYLEKQKQEDDFAPTLLTGRISDRPAEYVINSTLLDNLVASASSLRDRRLGNVPEKVLDSIAIIHRNPSSEVFLKANRNARGVNWEVLLHDARVDANYSKIKSLIEQMNERVIIDFVEEGKPEDYGIDPSQEGAMVVAFNFKLPGKTNADGTVGKKEDVSRVLRLGWMNGDVPRLFANYQGEPHIYELDPGFAGLLSAHPVKWRSLNVLSFNPFRMKKLKKEVRGQGIINLEYNNVRASWAATRSDGTDVSSSLDRAMAASLRDRLSSLKAIGWNLNVAEGYRLLETPDAVFTIVINELDPAINQLVEKTVVLKLAESKGIVYGRIDDNPDLFFLDRNKYRSLIQPLTSFAAP
ncbi:MAG: DUF4340 domain-containing protein [Verrucomicrobiales bacterium]|nr:DUF4340 domain-containing protein [Verrucomicrobiales bacterium]